MDRGHDRDARQGDGVHLHVLLQLSSRHATSPRRPAAVGADAAFWARLPLGRGVALLAHDACGVAALAKPAGILSHPNHRDDVADALLCADYHLEAGEFYEWPVPATAPPDARQASADGAGVTAGTSPAIPVKQLPSRATRSASHDLPSSVVSSPVEPAPTRRLWLLNRLDAGTSGVILVAASAALAEAVRLAFKERQVRKVYAALVFGRPSQPSAAWRDRLAVHKSGGQIETRSGGNIPAEAIMTLLRQSHHRSVFPLSLLQLEPQTGRSHQLRVQCAQRQLPVVGDGTYGDFRRNRDFAKATGEKRLFLHSLETSFDYVWQGESHAFRARAPLPPEFEAALRG